MLTVLLATKDAVTPLTVSEPLLLIENSLLITESSVTVREPPAMTRGSSLRMLLTVTSPEIVMTGFTSGRLMTTSSSAPGTVPLLQLLGSFQSPFVPEIQAMASSGASILVNWRLKGAAKKFPAGSAMIPESRVSWWLPTSRGFSGKISTRFGDGVSTPWRETIRSSPPPTVPSAPRWVSVTPDISKSEVSSASLKMMLMGRVLRPKPPAIGNVALTSGAKVSGITSKVREFDRVLLPPVSVARTRTSRVVAPATSWGAVAERSKGKETSLRATSPSNNSSTFRTCTSSSTAALNERTEPSTTWIPGEIESASITEELSVTLVGACPWLSKER